jgi:hypothetical protein
MSAWIAVWGSRRPVRRRATALVGVLIVLGVLMLDAHAALPEHHHVHGTETACVASLAVAALATAGAMRKRCKTLVQVWFPLLIRLPAGPAPTQPQLVAIRAGPRTAVVLRR